MTNKEAVIWLINLTADIGKAEHRALWHYEQALSEMKKMLESRKPKTTPIYFGDGLFDGEIVLDMAECPSCGYIYDEDDSVWGEPFCPHCGQELEWEGEQDES